MRLLSISVVMPKACNNHLLSERFRFAATIGALHLQDISISSLLEYVFFAAEDLKHKCFLMQKCYVFY